VLALVWVAGCSADAAEAPTFQRDIAPVLEERCTARGGCHGDEPTQEVTLDLRAGAAYRELVGVTAELGAPLLRVAPGNARASMLVRKLSGPLARDEGSAMPSDDVAPLPAHFVDDMLVPWINAGATEATAPAR